ncbi:MAG: hypothetical protein EXQ86_11030 [Rhodospirillales bacterium]|nr:hypothetical protein [Rhodospirillales bacterium]
MKVSDIGGNKDIAAAKRKKKVDGSGSEFADELRHAAETSAGAPGPSAVAGVGAIVSVQEVPDAGEGRSRGLLRRYGTDLLDQLEGFRHAILVGAVPKDKLAALAQRMRQKRIESTDPKLNEIIDEIELRAEVEIAKLTRDA